MEVLQESDMKTRGKLRVPLWWKNWDNMQISVHMTHFFFCQLYLYWYMTKKNGGSRSQKTVNSNVRHISETEWYEIKKVCHRPHQKDNCCKKVTWRQYQNQEYHYGDKIKTRCKFSIHMTHFFFYQLHLYWYMPKKNHGNRSKKIVNSNARNMSET